MTTQGERSFLKWEYLRNLSSTRVTKFSKIPVIHKHAVKDRVMVKYNNFIWMVCRCTKNKAPARVAQGWAKMGGYSILKFLSVRIIRQNVRSPVVAEKSIHIELGKTLQVIALMKEHSVTPVLIVASAAAPSSWHLEDEIPLISMESARYGIMLLPTPVFGSNLPISSDEWRIWNTEGKIYTQNTQ
ncbi:9bb634e2-81bf-4daa-abae-ea1eebb16872 [Sclerotinia trifoliorum]|uniref:9bb634e2-81bf-4daa-abae-ea1eebb16872 n=1 Tax=Sclerotinia trifoliorum TaxID=28548 RepID=A0A8H2VYS9_9HELO|nr:9bb634e2-81bf-4daa-abae-ea1eebb16872 [Sclerotinia trifoliorum]